MGAKVDRVTDLISTDEAAKIAGVNVKTITRWFDVRLIGGELVPMGLRAMRRVSRASLEAYLASRKNDADQRPG